MLVIGGQMGNLLEKEEEDDPFQSIWDEMEELEPSMPDETIVIGNRTQKMEPNSEQSSHKKKKTRKKNDQRLSASPVLSSSSTSGSNNTPKDEGQPSVASNGLHQNGQLATSSKPEKEKRESKNEFKSSKSSGKYEAIRNGQRSHNNENGLESNVNTSSKIEKSEKGGSKTSKIPVTNDHDAAPSENGHLPEKQDTPKMHSAEKSKGTKESKSSVENDHLPHGQRPGTSSVCVPCQVEPHPRNEIPEEDIRVMEEVGCELCSV